jgi:hypothetical protein
LLRWPVWRAPDAAQVGAPIDPSERQEVLDAIVRKGNDLVIVMENKVVTGGVTEQFKDREREQ